MRVALISDIHGNFVALKTVLAEVEAAKPDRIVCLGDVFALGPQPVECAAAMVDLGCPVVMGNTDAALLDMPPGVEAAPDDEKMRRINERFAWCAQQLAQEGLKFVRTFKPTVEVLLDDEVTLLCVHAEKTTECAKEDLAALKKKLARAMNS